MHDLRDRRLIGIAEVEDLRRLAIQPVSQFLDGLHVAACSLFDVRPCDLAQLLQVYAFAHIGKLEAQSFAIDLIALLTAGVSGYVAVAHFGWSTLWFHLKCPSRSPVISGVATRKTAQKTAQDCGTQERYDRRLARCTHITSTRCVRSVQYTSRRV